MNAETISSYIEQAAAEKGEQNFGGHIFYKLLAHIENRLTFAQKTNIIWAFTNTEKALNEARRGNENYSLFYFDQLKKHMNRDSAVTPEVYNFIILPAEAFYEYNCTRNYDLAISMLIESIASINRLIDKEQCYFMQSAASEQYLNICRVMYKQQKKDEAFAQLGQLILHVCTGNAHLDYAPLSTGSLFNRWGDEQRAIMLHYFTDVALFKYLEKGKPEPEHAEPGLLFNGLLHNRGEAMQTEYMDTYLKCASFILKVIGTPGETTMAHAEAAMQHFGKMPRTMQYLLLTQVQVLHDGIYGHSDMLNQQVKRYCTDKLRLGHLFSPEETTGNFTRSPLRVTGEGAVVA